MKKIISFNNDDKKVSYLMLILILLFPLGLTARSIEKSQNKKPNIVLVITDDQGKNDLACEGNPYIKTPNIDAFYKNAIRLDNFHVSTTCSPTRGALLTGRHTDRVNTFHTIAGRSLLFEDEVLLSQILAQNGYVNGMFGKWHLGDNYPFRPIDRGFHESVLHGGGGIGQTPDYWGNDYFDDHYWHNGVPKQYSGYCTDVFFSEALDFIEENKEQPFFCYISTNAPHGPHNCPEEYIDLYKDNDNVPDRHKRFYGMITNIDDNFKILQDKLKKLKLTNNTIVIFMTDNGTAGGQVVYDAGMSGQKGSVTEGGHRTPFYIQWPAGNLSGGRDITELTAHYDILPTMVDLLGLNFTPVKPLDGKSIVPLLIGNNTNWENRILFVDTQRELNLVKYKEYAVMDNRWRLINGNKLYDVTKDLKQSNNVIDEHPEVAKLLAQSYEKWWQSIMSEGANETYAYIKAGSVYENPVRISAHDMMTGDLGYAWHQHGVIEATQAAGIWKIEFVEDGDYEITLCRFPRESEFGVNSTFPAESPTRRIAQPAPASHKSDFEKAFLYVGKYKKTVEIKGDEKEINFQVNMPAGKYDMEARLIDKDGRVHPSYYLYIEKIN